MKIGLQIPDFTWPGNPEQLGPTLATIASQITPLEIMGRDVIPAVAPLGS